MNHIQKPRYFSFLIPLFFFFLFNSYDISAQDGEALFKANCTSCHKVDEKVIGPPLQGVTTRRKHDWLVKWVKNSQAVVKSGDADAVALFKEYNVVMPAFNLKEDEINSILTYIQNYKPPVSQTPVTPVGGPAEEPKSPWLWLLIAAVVLYLLSGVLRRTKETLEKTVREKNGVPEPAPVTKYRKRREWVRQNKKLIAVILLLVTVVGSVKAWYAMMAIGITQGYTPDQPIAYSHKLHAGEMQISCIYCHSGAERGKTAGIPSANVCMNCHKAVKTSTYRENSTAEIAKIYKALDYDPDKGTYGPNQKPIQWVRVHNLPDFAYFNHSQHVVVGKLACQTCHGPVQDSMTVASQYSPLTMNWCITCHRNTNVQMKGNAYYDDLHKSLTAKYGSDSALTVDKIGGTECARCHY
jgi:cytochrome c551/c552